MVTELIFIALGIAAGKSKIKTPAVGKLWGNRSSKRDIFKEIREGKSGNINNGDLYYENGVMFDEYGNLYFSRDAKDEAINKSLIDNQKHIRIENRSPYALNIEEFLLDNNNEYCDTPEEAYYKTLRSIAGGSKFLWYDRGVKKGLESVLFGKPSPEEKKYFSGVISDDGETIESYGEKFAKDRDGSIFVEEIAKAISDAPSQRKAKKLLKEIYNSYLIDMINKNTYNQNILSENLPF